MWLGGVYLVRSLLAVERLLAVSCLAVVNSKKTKRIRLD